MELSEYADVTAGNLPYGAQRRLEIARAMATEPKLLLLDEPAAGMNPQETEDLMRMKELRNKGKTFGEIADAMGRSQKGVAEQYRRVYGKDR